MKILCSQFKHISLQGPVIFHRDMMNYGKKYLYTRRELDYY